MKKIISQKELTAEFKRLKKHFQELHGQIILYDFPKVWEKAEKILSFSKRDHYLLTEANEILAQIVPLFGDHHARIPFTSFDGVKKYLPFFLRRNTLGGQTKFFALCEQKEVVQWSFYHSDYPILKEIEEIPLHDWCHAITPFMSNHCSQVVRDIFLGDALVFIGFFYQKLLKKLPPPEITITLANTTGESIKEKIKLQDEYPQRTQVWQNHPEKRFHWIKPDIAYFRCEVMWFTEEHAAFSQWHQAMKKAQGSRGIIIDLRYNNGGSRYFLNHFFPYFMPEDYMVATAVLCRRDSRAIPLPSALSHGVGNRSLYRSNDTYYSEEEKKFLLNYQKEKFNTHHLNTKDYYHEPAFHLIRRNQPWSYSYQGKVIILMHGNASSSEAFLSGVQQLPGIKTLGTPTLGTSGAEKYSYETSWGQSFKISRTLSLNARGKVIEGNSFDADEYMELTPNLLISNYPSTSDPMIERSIEIIES